MVNEKKSMFSQASARKSSESKTLDNKACLSCNALAHGMLSAGLLLKNEYPADYDQLFQSLVDDMRPRGALALIHVERAAVAIWRQRRLIRAGSAAVAFRQAADDTREMLTDTLGAADSSRIVDEVLHRYPNRFKLP